MGRNVGGARNGLGCVPDRIYRGVSDWEDGVMELLPCPFCGGSDIVSEGFNIFSVRCRSCGASTAPRETASNAEGNWNYRVSPFSKKGKELDVEKVCEAMLNGVGCTPWSSSTWDNDGTDGSSREGVRESVRRIIDAMSEQTT